MSTKLIIETDKSSGMENLSALDGHAGGLPHAQGQSLSRKLTAHSVSLRCPQCDSIVYSRRHKLCGVCSQPLPDSFSFSAEEGRRLEKILESEKRRRREWMTKTFKDVVAL